MTGTSSIATCPDDHTLTALIEHVLSDDDAARVTSHLDDCATCRAVVAAALRSDAPGDPAIAPATGTPTLFGFGTVRGTQLLRDTRVGRYQVRELLGVGGMGQVYEAYDDALDRAIALKILRPELAGPASGLAERLERESRIMAKVVHPAVIAVHDVGRAADTVYIAMELVRGQTLRAYLAGRAARWREVASLFERAGQGLAAAHRAGVVHRDFKPDNVLVETATGRVIVTDFGIAQAASAETGGGGGGGGGDRATDDGRAVDWRLTATGVAIGTLSYMAPEQLAGEHVDQRADVFAFCVALWEAWFGVRPFPGDSPAVIGAAMEQPLQRPAHSAVPRRLVRVVERGLAIDPAARWDTLSPILAALAAPPSRARLVAIAAGVAAVLCASIAGALALARQPVDDPCARALATVARADDPVQRAALGAALATAPAVRATATASVALATAAWRATERATCRADRVPAQDPNVTACLDARRSELLGYVDDLITDGAAGAPFAARQTKTMISAWKCVNPAPGVMAAAVPADPRVRRVVTGLRHREYQIEDVRGRDGYPVAIAAATALLHDGESVWPRLHAELLYTLGATQAEGDADADAQATLRQAASVAEAARDDYTAAISWITLIADTGAVQGDPTRQLEYAAYAQAASDRLGQPELLKAQLADIKGIALTELHRLPEAELELRQAVELGRTTAPSMLPQAIQGLGNFYEDQGRYRAAVTALRQALAALPPPDDGYTPALLIVREHLATSLSTLGQDAEAEAYARDAVAIADRTVQAENIDRAFAHAILGQVLQTAGKPAEALVEAHSTTVALAAITGEHSEQYGTALLLEAGVLADLRRDRDAAAMFERACGLIGFNSRVPTETQAECWTSAAPTLVHLGRGLEALALFDRAIPVTTAAHDAQHPQVAIELFARGSAYAQLGKHALAIADLARAVELLTGAELDPGYLAASQWVLARELWTGDRARGAGLLAAALDHFKTSSGMWAAYQRDAAAWLASDGHPRGKPETY